MPSSELEPLLEAMIADVDAVTRRLEELFPPPTKKRPQLTVVRGGRDA
jgi:hypothetical protein